jgi:hypothetical protein
MDECHLLRTFIKDHFIERQLEKPSFSLRFFSGLLGLNPGTFSLFLRSKRQVSDLDYKKICDYFQFNDEEREYYAPLSLSKPKDIEYKDLELSEDTSRIWNLMVVMPYIERFTCTEELFNFLRNHRVEREDIDHLISLLVEKKLIKLKGTKYSLLDEKAFKESFIRIIPSGIKKSVIQENAAELIDIMKDKLRTCGPEERYYNMCLVPMSEKEFNSFKLKVRLIVQDILNDSVDATQTIDQKPYFYMTSVFPIENKEFT